MNNRKAVFILPATVLAILLITVALLVTGCPIYLVVYCALITVLAFFSAKQSIDIHAALNWGFDDFNQEDLAAISGVIVRDFARYVLLYTTVFSVIYFGLYFALF